MRRGEGREKVWLIILLWGNKRFEKNNGRMKRCYCFFAVLFVALLIPIDSFSEVKLPAVFGDNMVLQQNTNAPIWGYASPNSTVKITVGWNRKAFTVKADNEGKWKITVQTPGAGGPYEITISDGKPVKLDNVLIGEVWVCSGQSNMEMPMRGYFNQPLKGSNEAIATSSNPALRLFTVAQASSMKPLDDFTGSWQLCEPENVSRFSATAYYFGLMLNSILKVPVGLINSSWGGTRIEPWINEEGLKKFDFVKLPDKNQQGKLSPQTPTVLFNAMINPMAGYSIKGTIWYQGESNSKEPDKYRMLLPGLAESWRAAWGQGDFPFYYVQIAPYDYGQTRSELLREAQMKASGTIPHFAMVSIMDIGERNRIHPMDKKAGGDRLAYLALNDTYGRSGFTGQSPVYKSMTIAGTDVKLTFDNATNGLTSFDRELSNFEVAGEDRVFYPAKAKIDGTNVVVTCPEVQAPVAVRYAFKNFVVGDLFNIEGMPASSFRTDDWDK